MRDKQLGMILSEKIRQGWLDERQETRADWMRGKELGMIGWYTSN